MPTGLEHRGWPFWAPSDLASVEAALDLADLAEGECFVDLGCGDGQVLVAAAQRGARVLGVEIDEDLAEQAREALAANGLAGDVVVADLLDLDLDADVVFTYLAPGTLQRLTPTLRSLTGARLVTVDFGVPDLVPDAVEGAAHLYRLPGRDRERVDVGWATAGVLIVTVDTVASLSVLEVGHPGGRVEVRVSPDLAAVGTFRPGLDVAEPGQPLAIDVRWSEVPAGTVASGELRISGLEPLALTVGFTADERVQGVWDLSPDSVANLAAALPTDPAQLLAAAES